MGVALYRKYRPATFDGVIGQEHITRTLRNQIISGRIGHAYLFCGSRGVGKTSMARIFARAINCENPQNAPCGHCNACKSNAGANLDINEIDAASNNGVDDARELRERVKYPPLSGKYKVYIIDEVHMLTGSAFNALLKTLEEPPAHAVFILATTEPHKLPATILSRCMRFDCKLVPINEIVALIKGVYSAEGKDADEDALFTIAAAAEGSVRDALSLADTAISCCEGRLTLQAVKNALGYSDDLTEKLFAKICGGDLHSALTISDNLISGGMNIQYAAKELARYARDLMVAALAPEILALSNERKNKLIAESKNYKLPALSAIVQLFLETDNALRYSSSPKIAFESAIFKAAKLYSLDPALLDQRLLNLERAVAELKSGTPAPVTAPPVVKEEFKEFTPPIKNNGEYNGDYNNNDGNINSYNNAGDAGESSVETGETNQSNQSVKTGAGAAKPTLNAQQLWGRAITFFRANGTAAQAAAMGSHNNKKLNIIGDVLKIFSSRDSYLTFCTEEFQSLLQSAIKKEGMTLRVLVEKDSGDIDMEKELSGFVNEFGRKLNITD